MTDKESVEPDDDNDYPVPTGTFICAGCGKEFPLNWRCMWSPPGGTPDYPAGEKWCYECTWKET